MYIVNTLAIDRIKALELVEHCYTDCITFSLTAVKDHVLKYIETTFSNYFCSIKTLPRSSKSCDCVFIRSTSVDS